MNEPTQGPSGAPIDQPAHGSAQPYSYPTPASPSGATQAVPGGVTLSDDPQPTPAGSRKRTGLLVGGVVTALVLGGAGAFAFQTLSGGGSQPAEVLPGDAYAYFRLDIDPSAGQKIAAVRFLGKLPQVKDTLGSDDPRKKLWELASKDASNDCVAKFSYDNDIAPWLGDRVGAAIRPGGTSDAPNVAIAVQVKDEGAAKDTLTKLFACDAKGDTELRMKNGYAIITPRGVGDTTLAAVDKGSLAQNTTFTEDMNALGEQGVVSAWFDMGSGLKEIQKLSGSSDLAAVPPAGAKGRVAAALRFDSDYVEMAGVVRGTDTKTSVKGDGAEVASLPADTMAAINISGADAMVDGAWPALKKQIETLAGTQGESDPIGSIEQQLDMKLPDDLKVLLGRSFTLAMPDQKFDSEVPTIGAKVVSSDAKRADELVGRLMDTAGVGSDVLTHKVEGDKVFVATTPDYADDLKAGGKLGDSDTFKLAVGDVTSSNATLFVDLDKIDKLAQGQVHGEAKSFLESLRAVGFNASNTGNGEGSFTLRVVGD
ncbi:hypothetical protein GCM10009721_02040 [Terrabacter tumescens]|uniref:DUF3352 domain-containing protein n=1 Tax=Terrabacter tumescens TaxID=60443 RepID=A0ABQ2HGR6_9MICO|nr:DUF3352 domain-containing protein [Terrabacter tumescens]GGM81228.1 hypothetical protein GCM10009721_02040 [Terrabacter tumescens]